MLEKPYGVPVPLRKEHVPASAVDVPQPPCTTTKFIKAAQDSTFTSLLPAKQLYNSFSLKPEFAV
jgi:hypothetical protein